MMAERKILNGVIPVTTTKYVYLDGTSKTLQQAIDNGELSVDLSSQIFNSLNTIDKTVLGAINELLSKTNSLISRVERLEENQNITPPPIEEETPQPKPPQEEEQPPTLINILPTFDSLEWTYIDGATNISKNGHSVSFTTPTAWEGVTLWGWAGIQAGETITVGVHGTSENVRIQIYSDGVDILQFETGTGSREKTITLPTTNSGYDFSIVATTSNTIINVEDIYVYNGSSPTPPEEELPPNPMPTENLLPEFTTDKWTYIAGATNVVKDGYSTSFITPTAWEGVSLWGWEGIKPGDIIEVGVNGTSENARVQLWANGVDVLGFENGTGTRKKVITVPESSDGYDFCIVSYKENETLSVTDIYAKKISTDNPSFVETDVYVRPEIKSDAKYVGSGQQYSTIQSAINAIGYSGGQIVIKGGTYTEKLSFSNSGKPNNPIVIMNAPDEKVILDGGNTGRSITMIALNGKSNIHIVGLEICNANCGTGSSRTAYGILGSGGEQGIVIADCEIHDIKTTGQGERKGEANAIIMYGESTTPISDVLIYNNHIYNMSTNWSESVSVAGNCENVRIINNRLHDLTNIAMDFCGNAGYCATSSLDQPRNCVMRGNVVYNVNSPYASAAAYYADGARDCVIERNIAYNCSCGIEIGAEEASTNVVGNIIIRNNLIYNCKGYEACTVKIGGYDSLSPSVTNVKFLNNTFVVTDSVSLFAWSKSDGVQFNNNIFYLTSTAGDMVDYVDYTPNNISFSNNIYYFKGKTESNFSITLNGSTNYNWSTWKSQYDTNGIYLTSSPFTNISGNDYTLANSSAAINKGKTLSQDDIGLYDLAGNNRVNNIIDIGCYEKQ